MTTPNTVAREADSQAGLRALFYSSGRRATLAHRCKSVSQLASHGPDGGKDGVTSLLVAPMSTAERASPATSLFLPCSFLPYFLSSIKPPITSVEREEEEEEHEEEHEVGREKDSTGQTDRAELAT